MKLAKIVLAGTATLMLAGPAALAQQILAQQTGQPQTGQAQAGQAQADQQTGQVTTVNRLNNTVAIRPIQNGTVGANAAGAEQEFKVQDGVSLEDLHAGNRITYSVMEKGGTKMLTGFKKQ